MSTIHTKKVGGVFEPVGIEENNDPYSEYTYQPETEAAEPKTSVQQSQQPTRDKQELFDGVDKMFEGANLVFDLANHFMDHLSGRRRR